MPLESDKKRIILSLEFLNLIFLNYNYIFYPKFKKNKNTESNNSRDAQWRIAAAYKNYINDSKLKKIILTFDIFHPKISEN